jgi:hypothetical protein
MSSALLPNSDIARRDRNFAFVCQMRNLNMRRSNPDQRHFCEDPLYGRHDNLVAEKQLAHSRPCLVLTHDVIGHRDKVTTAAVER